MKLNLKKELPIIATVMIPFIYLAYKWPRLPEQVPVHWNIEGEIDRYGSKWELLIIPILLPLLTYGIFLVIPFIDPKKKLEQMGNKYHQLKFFFVALMSALATYILYITGKQEIFHPTGMFILMGLIFIVLGNYLPSVKPNYFLGIRTPWTLENEVVWKKTHRRAGILFILIGIVSIILPLMLPLLAFFWFYFAFVMIIVIYLVVYSYLEFQKINK